MTNEQQQAACAELARRMGWTDIQWLSGCQQGRLQSSRLEPIPDPFDDPLASRELVKGLAADRDRMFEFCEALKVSLGLSNGMFAYEVIEKVITAPLPVIARAACKATGIEVEE